MTSHLQKSQSLTELQRKKQLELQEQNKQAAQSILSRLRDQLSQSECMVTPIIRDINK